MYCAKTAEPIEMLFGEADSCWSEKSCVRWGQDGTNQFAAARGDKSGIRPFSKSLWTLVVLHPTKTG